MGEVVVAQESETSLVSHEKGIWLLPQNQQVAFRNAFRWTLERGEGRVSLEHLHLGPNAPVFLISLAPTGINRFSSVDHHICKNDIYRAEIEWDQHSIRVNWRVNGPKKNEEMEFLYF